MRRSSKEKRILAVGGGKGGVGKSIVAIGLGAILAKREFKVVMVDLDLGGANLHTYLGVLEKTPTVSDFMLKRVSSLKEATVKTPLDNLELVSGGDFIPGTANPLHWIKLKLIRHIQSLPADFVIVDLGAGANFNTLDFFNMADTGFVVTICEPGAVINAYTFLKSALFRRLQNVFRKHPLIGPLIESETKRRGTDKKVTLDWLLAKVKEIDSEMFLLVDEIKSAFQPALILNRASKDSTCPFVKNLTALCRDRLGFTLRYTGNLPEVRMLSRYLLNLPGLYDKNEGKPFFDSLEHVIKDLGLTIHKPVKLDNVKKDFTDDEIQEIIRFIDSLDDQLFDEASKNTCKLRMFYKPHAVLEFLMKKGVVHRLFVASP